MEEEQVRVLDGGHGFSREFEIRFSHIRTLTREELSRFLAKDLLEDFLGSAEDGTYYLEVRRLD